ncbi:Glycosyltransferase involved in cell wall bisynthesis [Segatella oulorum]|uniref:Glycosyltransferase involved in cell wall bisynthesis n=1 Tax=Segatella oulorum TaxID=28136 RepID=A0A1T4P6P7_9BACT|nr:glycosyltransferase [Segatella oulorum]SJZ87260.1 Glycosyltransferase involved in cell wall bisynthesis [Segatella oulorum]
MQPKVSVIVAVYNVAPFLDKCLTSLKAQTLKDFEVILVDDGSTDNSGKMCDAYAQEDNRFKIFHKANGGVASAREFGVGKASGLYMIHADPDDWVEPTMLEELYNRATETDADVIICDFYVESSFGRELVVQCPKSPNHIVILNQYLNSSLYGACWNKLVRREVWNNLNVHFPPIKLCEDMWVNIKLAMTNIRFAYLDKAFYHYVRIDRVGSLTKGYNVQAGINAYEASVCFRDLLQNTSYWHTYVRYSMPWMAYLALYYNAVSARKFKQEFRELQYTSGVTWLLRLSVQHYWLGQLILWVRKSLGKLRHGK